LSQKLLEKLSFGKEKNTLNNLHMSLYLGTIFLWINARIEE